MLSGKRLSIATLAAAAAVFGTVATPSTASATPSGATVATLSAVGSTASGAELNAMSLRPMAEALTRLSQTTYSGSVAWVKMVPEQNKIVVSLQDPLVLNSLLAAAAVPGVAPRVEAVSNPYNHNQLMTAQNDLLAAMPAGLWQVAVNTDAPGLIATFDTATAETPNLSWLGVTATVKYAPQATKASDRTVATPPSPAIACACLPPPTPARDRQDDQAAFSGGARTGISSTRQDADGPPGQLSCGLGPSGKDANGTWILIAGHCGANGDAVYTQNTNQRQASDGDTNLVHGPLIGYIVGDLDNPSASPTVHSIDIAKIRTSAIPFVWNGLYDATATTDVESYAIPAIGDLECASGDMSGTVCNLKVLATSTPTIFAGTTAVQYLDVMVDQNTSTTIGEGDSGSPVGDNGTSANRVPRATGLIEGITSNPVITKPVGLPKNATSKRPCVGGAPDRTGTPLCSNVILMTLVADALSREGLQYNSAFY